MFTTAQHRPLYLPIVQTSRQGPGTFDRPSPSLLGGRSYIRMSPSAARVSPSYTRSIFLPRQFEPAAPYFSVKSSTSWSLHANCSCLAPSRPLFLQRYASFNLPAYIHVYGAIFQPSTVQSRTASVYNLPGDPSFRNAESDLSSVISCPTGQSDPKTGMSRIHNNRTTETHDYSVLLVPGTVEAADTFYGDNFAKLLPANGFPYCYLLLPSHSLTDAQLT